MRCGHPNDGQAHLCDPENQYVYTDDNGNDHDVCDPTKLLNEIEELTTELGFMELKEKLHLRLIAAGNNELAKRGEKIETLLKLVDVDTNGLDERDDRIKELEEFVSHEYMSMVNHHEKLDAANDRIKELEEFATWVKNNPISADIREMAKGILGED